MPTEIPDLWGDDIKVDVLPPSVILRAQATLIGRKTQGILSADVVSSTSDEDGERWEEHTLQVFATSAGYRESILTVYHSANRVYPVTIQLPEDIDWGGSMIGSSRRVQCYTPEEFMPRLGTALQSRPTQAVIATLLARSNETKLSTR
jgi:hypothetical protein